MYSQYLADKKPLLEKLVKDLSPDYSYVSVLGKQITGKQINVSTTGTAVKDTYEAQCGFVVKMFNGENYSEYAFSDVTEDGLNALSEKIRTETCLTDHLRSQHIDCTVIDDEPLVKDFSRPISGASYTVQELVEKLTALRDKIRSASEKIIQCQVRIDYYEVSAVFVSKNRALTQNYGWASVSGLSVARDGEKIQDAHTTAAANSIEKALEIMDSRAISLGELSVELLNSEMIEPGIYDIITAPSITGLIAHEAFGHGVEMDMFVKKRARSRHYIGKPVASKLVNMHDGAGVRVPAEPVSDSIESVNADPGFMTDPCIGYFFDDDGVLSKDTLIIRDGILQTGISDAVSAAILGTVPTGNGRRQEPSHKAYTRMTNTYFAPGESELSDMIASIEHGYMIFDTSNGMEDPKNWNIQCVAGYGREIRNGQFTGKIVSPVVMSGYVPDLLMSISMVSKEWQIIGSGHCGKGYKEWVPVSDGGPYLKCRCKLG